MGELTLQAQRQIGTLCDRWPKIRAEWVVELAGLALAAGKRPLEQDRKDKGAARGTLKKLADEVQGLLNRLEDLSTAESAALVAVGLNVGGKVQDLRAFRDCLWHAGNNLEQQTRGRPMERRTLLVLETARELERLGLHVDARPNGALCGVVGTIAEIAGDEIKDVAATVRNVLKARKIQPAGK